MTDSFGRKIDYLRISVTDKCNLNCSYCMPQEKEKPSFSSNHLSLDEITRICRIMSNLGIKKIKITGGEPLIRKDILDIIKNIKSISSIENISLTTNGIYFSHMADSLLSAGLDCVNFSLDTLDAKNFFNITGKNKLHDVLQSIEKAIFLKFNSIKINFTSIKELNFESISDIAALSKLYPIDVRFIELMPIGAGKNFTPIYSNEIKKILEEKFGAPKETSSSGNGPAKYFYYPNFLGKIGFINPLSECFCSNCNKIRITSEGNLKLCLNHRPYINLKELLRDCSSDLEISDIIKKEISKKPLNHGFFKNFDEKKGMYSIGG